MTTGITQATVVPQKKSGRHQGSMNLALFKPDGSPLKPNEFDQITVGNAIGTQGKTTTSPEPVAGSIVPVKFTNGNSADQPTIAFNGGTARQIKLGGTRSAAAKITLAAAGVAVFYFDGTVLHQLGVYS